MGRVGFYELGIMELELELKTQTFNTNRPTLDLFGHLDPPMGLRVGSNLMDGSGLMGWWTTLFITHQIEAWQNSC